MSCKNNNLFFNFNPKIDNLLLYDCGLDIRFNLNEIYDIVNINDNNEYKMLLTIKKITINNKYKNHTFNIKLNSSLHFDDGGVNKIIKINEVDNNKYIISGNGTNLKDSRIFFNILDGEKKIKLNEETDFEILASFNLIKRRWSILERAFFAISIAVVIYCIFNRKPVIKQK